MIFFLQHLIEDKLFWEGGMSWRTEKQEILKDGRIWIYGARKRGQAGQERQLEYKQWELTWFLGGVVRRHLLGMKQVLQESILEQKLRESSSGPGSTWLCDLVTCHLWVSLSAKCRIGWSLRYLLTLRFYDSNWSDGKKALGMFDWAWVMENVAEEFISVYMIG